MINILGTRYFVLFDAASGARQVHDTSVRLIFPALHLTGITGWKFWIHYIYVQPGLQLFFWSITLAGRAEFNVSKWNVFICLNVIRNEKPQIFHRVFKHS